MTKNFSPGEWNRTPGTLTIRDKVIFSNAIVGTLINSPKVVLPCLSPFIIALFSLSDSFGERSESFFAP